MSMQTLTWDVDAAAVAGNSDAYSLALATQARQKLHPIFCTYLVKGWQGGLITNMSAWNEEKSSTVNPWQEETKTI